jgi:hypothetical protein
MTLPKRWIEDRSESTPLERAILRPALKVAIPSSAEQRIWTRLAATVPLTAVALSASTAAGSSAATAAAPAAAGAAGGAGAIGGGAKFGLAVVAKAFAIGAATGALFAGGVSAVAPPSSQDAASAPAVQSRAAESARPSRSNYAAPRGPIDEPATAERVAPPQSPARAASPEPREPAARDSHQSAVPSVGALPAQAAPAASPAPAAASRLREEALILRRAREALRQGNLSAAFSELEVARTQFPRGALGEEREALTIELLVRSGQRDAARQRAEVFLRSFPNSAHASNVRKLAF